SRPAALRSRSRSSIRPTDDRQKSPAPGASRHLSRRLRDSGRVEPPQREAPLTGLNGPIRLWASSGSKRGTYMGLGRNAVGSLLGATILLGSFGVGSALAAGPPAGPGD